MVKKGVTDGRLQEERCECGSLLSKVSKDSVEIKCRRCKRIHVISIKDLKARIK
jgi:phage FluMu protein Com